MARKSKQEQVSEQFKKNASKLVSKFTADLYQEFSKRNISLNALSKKKTQESNLESLEQDILEYLDWYGAGALMLAMFTIEQRASVKKTSLLEEFEFFSSCLEHTVLETIAGEKIQ